MDQPDSGGSVDVPRGERAAEANGGGGAQRGRTFEDRSRRPRGTRPSRREERAAEANGGGGAQRGQTFEDISQRPRDTR